MTNATQVTKFFNEQDCLGQLSRGHGRSFKKGAHDDLRLAIGTPSG